MIDPYQWLHEVEGPRALAWVDAHNRPTQERLEKHPEFAAFKANSLAALDSEQRIPTIQLLGDRVYNFWKDSKHPRGLLRRAPVASYHAAEPDWEIVLDVDQLAAAENQSWVYMGMVGLRPDYGRGLITLSPGGTDAVVVREFDLVTRRFVVDGFKVPESKSRVHWGDANSVFVSSDFGPGSLTTSGYPRILKLWRRGTDLTAAQTIFTGKADDVLVDSFVLRDQGQEHVFIRQMTTFFTQKTYVYRDAEVVPLALPDDARPWALHKGALIVGLRSDWSTNGASFKSGSLVSVNLDDLLAGHATPRLVWAPEGGSSLQDCRPTSEHLILNILRNAQSELRRAALELGDWRLEPLPAPSLGTVNLMGTSEDAAGYWFIYESFLQPRSLYHCDGVTVTQIRGERAFFDATALVARQEWVVSKDGTRVPYFLIHRRDLKANQPHPTLLYGYGGFEISMNPSYLSIMGRNWLEKGGVYAVANIRGGGEFGPAWHQAARKKNRMRAFEDFISVADALVASGITDAARLASMGGSNGGLLVGSTFVLRPELFKAVVCQVPLLDMRHYHRLLAGASWMDEYGDPDDPEMWEVIKTYSPYHNLKANVVYPHVLFLTSTKDDRVHPGHARKMAARMEELGAAVSYFENREGGHAGAADNPQIAYRKALEFSFLWEQLGPPA